MQRKFLLSLLFLFQLNAFSLPLVQWQKSLGGSGDESAACVQQTADGGYIVAGYSGSNDGNVSGNHGNDDYWIVKLTAAGAIQWQKCHGGSDYDQASAIQQTKDRGYIVAGLSYSTDGEVTENHGDDDYWIVKLDSNGVLQWQKSFGGSDDDEPTSIQQTTDGGYIVAGYTYSIDSEVTGNHGGYDYWVVKIDSGGDMQWQKCLGGSNDDQAYSIEQTADSGYIVAGSTFSNDGDVSGNHDTTGNYHDYWIVKLTSGGSIQWQKCLGGSNDDEAVSIEQTNDKGYIVAGYSYSNDGDVSGNHGDFDYWVVKLDSGGSIQWQKSLGGTSYDFAYSIRQTYDSGYIVTGYTGSNDSEVTGDHLFLNTSDSTLNPSDDYWVVKLAANGAFQWQKCLGGAGDEHGYSIWQATDEGYIVAGESDSTSGDVTGNHGNYDYWVVKLSPLNSIEEPDVAENGLKIFPNPLTTSCTLLLDAQVTNAEVTVYDIVGKCLMRKKLTGNAMEIEKGSLESGVYFVNVANMERQWVGKMVVE